MSTTIPIQDLDPSTSPPSDRTIRAVVTLSWPYSSSTRQCALLLSERDFRLRARGGQIRVKFSGPAARAVAGSRLGIGDEVLLELGAGEWASGAAVHVPGKSIGELLFDRGVRLMVQKEGSEAVEVSVAEDAVDEVEEETSPLETTPAEGNSPVTTFRSSIGGAPGSAAIYSSPAYMRKAAKFSYLDGISRLFEDEWDNQDLPRKKARTSMGDVKSWKVVDRTPSPERSSPAASDLVEEDMVDASEDEHTNAEDVVVENLLPVASVSGQEPIAEMQSAISSPTPAPTQQDLKTSSPASVANPRSSPPPMIAVEALEEQQSIDTPATINPSTLPKLRLPSASPTPQPNELENLKEQAIDPTTPRLVPLPSAALPSTTPQISPLTTKDVVAAETDDGSIADVETLPHGDLPSGTPVGEVLTSPSKATESLLDQLKSTVGESEPATEPIAPGQVGGSDVQGQWEANDLAEEDAFSDDEGNETLSAHENDDELMLEEDAEDVFDADELEGDEPSDDDTNEDFEMHHLPAQQWLEESTTEKDSDLEEQAVPEDHLDSETTTGPHAFEEGQAEAQQPGFAPASTLLHAAETPAKAVQPAVAMGETTTITPSKVPFFGFDGAVPSTEAAEVETPAAKPTDTPKRTPQSARDKVMKRTFHSLFGLKATPSPEKEDMPREAHTADTEQVIPEQADQHVADLNSAQIGQPLGSGADDLQITQTLAVNALDDVAAEPIVAQEESLQGQDELQKHAEPQEMPAVISAADDAIDSVSHDIQEEAIQPEPSVLEHEESPELINLDSSSDAEVMNDDSLEEPAGDQAAVEPPVSAPTPQKRSVENGSEIRSSVAADSDHAESTVASPQDDVDELPALDSHVPDAEEQSDLNYDSNVEPVLPVEDLQELDVHAPEDVDMGVFEQEGVSAVPEAALQPDQFGIDSLEKSPALSLTPRSPTVEVEKSITVDMDLDEQPQPEPLHNPVYLVSAGVDEVSPEPFEFLQPAVSYQELDAESEPAPFDATMVVQDAVEVFDNVRDNDVEMLDDERRESESSQSSIQSQVIHDSADAQQQILHEHTRRSTSRDTVEDFSPIVTESTAQTTTDLVNEEGSPVRSQKLLSQDNIEGRNTQSQGIEMPSIADFVEEDLLEQTPTRSTKLEVVEIGSSPSDLHTISPVKFTQIAQEQEPTPQATFDDVQEPNATDKDIDVMQDIPENPEYLSATDAQALESQLQMTEVEDERVSPTAVVPEQLEQDDVPNELNTTGEKDGQTHITLPISPSATQSVQPEAQLSHASTYQATMQPTPATSQLQSSVQLDAEPDLLEISENIADMPQAESREQEPTEPSEMVANALQLQSREKESNDMPPPEQSLPPKTPAKKSLRSRLSNVPDVISAWFSPKRSSIAAQQPEERAEIETPAAVKVSSTETTYTPKRRVSGISTAHSYFTSLASLGQHVNPSSQQVGTVDVLAIVTDVTKEPERAKGGPKDYFTICRVTDPSMTSSADIRVEVFRPWKAVLPAADAGDVMLLRAFVVKSKKRQPYLLSTDTSAWCVWRFAEHSKASARGGAGVGDGEKPVWARRMSHSEVREEVKGPPVEYGIAEKEQARKLRDWWTETHNDAGSGAFQGLVGEKTGEESEVVEL